MTNEITDDMTAFLLKHLAAVVIWGGIIVGGFLGWNLNSTVAIERAIAANTERSLTTQSALSEYIRESTSVGKENQAVLNQIRTDVAVIKRELRAE